MLKKFFLVGLLLTLIFAVQVRGEGYDYRASDTLYALTMANLNLRSGPGTGYSRIVTVNAGTRVSVVDKLCGAWHSVVVGERTGYMYAEFLLVLPYGVFVGAPELIHWDDARSLVPRGYVFTVIDVRSGLSWQMAAFSLGSHADVETITANDTAIMREAFGGWTWTPRPMIVLAQGRALAASLNGMPHAGWTRGGNNMNGHVCLHFHGSLTHNRTISHERDHQNAVMEAFRYGARWLVEAAISEES